MIELTSCSHRDYQLSSSHTCPKQPFSQPDLEVLLPRTGRLGDPNTKESPDKGSYGCKELASHRLRFREARFDEDGVVSDLPPRIWSAYVLGRLTYSYTPRVVSRGRTSLSS